MRVLSDIALIFSILLVLTIAVTVIAHLFVPVVYVPTPRRIVERMVKAAKLRKGDIVYDLGAGDGRLLIAAKKKCPAIHARGWELIPTIWLLSRMCAWWAGVKVDLRCGNAFTKDVSDADVIFLYLFPDVMESLVWKFDRELKPGTRVISHTFRFPKREAVEVIECEKKKVYVYRW